MRGIVLALVLFPALVVAAEDFIRLPGGEFRSTLKYEDTGGKVHLPPFALMQRPVTNAEFLDFVKANPQWQRDQVAPVFAESRYLQQWAAPLEPGNNAKPMQPVVNVSWFAAQAFCEARGARLPTWNEWEFAAAADATRRDARAEVPGLRLQAAPSDMTTPSAIAFQHATLHPIRTGSPGFVVFLGLPRQAPALARPPATTR